MPCIDRCQPAWNTADVAGIRKPGGPASRRAAANLQRIRRKRGLSVAELARRTAQAGQAILDTGILKTERGDRRMDIDDLVVLSAVLDVSPATLLLPETIAPMVQLDADQELTPGISVPLGTMWAWARGEMPLVPAGDHAEAEFILDNAPHRFTLNAPRDAPVWEAMTRMAALIASELNKGVTPWQLRTVFEQALVACLNDRARNGQD